MAISLRRILRKYSLLAYPNVNGQNSFRDRRNIPSYTASAIKVNQNCCAPGIPYPSSNHLDMYGRENHLKKNEKNIWENELALLGSNACCDRLYLLPVLDKELIYCAKEYHAYRERETQKQIGSPYEKPTLSQLQTIYHKLCNDLPRIFEEPIDHNIYHKNLIFENNILGTKTVGIRNYLNQIAVFKMFVFVKYSAAKFELLKITTHPEDGTIRVRWRIRGISGFKVMVLFWRQKVWREKGIVDELEGWFDGFSIFFVKGDGLIHKHVASQMMPKYSGSGARFKPALAAKVPFIVDLSINDFSSTSLPEVDKEKKS